MDNTEPRADAAFLGTKGESKRAGLRLTRSKRRRIRGAVEAQGDNIRPRVAAGDARGECAPVCQCDRGIGSLGKPLFGCDDDVLPPEP